MTVLGKPYTLDDFNKLIFSVRKYELPETVFDIFKTIETNIDIPVFSTPSYSANRDTYNTNSSHDDAYRESRDHYGEERVDKLHSRYGPKTPQSHSSHIKDTKDRYTGKGKPKRDTATTEDWGVIRTFKPTKIEVKMGADKTINDLRIHLNKMSASNYAKQRDTIIAEIRNYLESENANHETTEKVSSAIFQIVSTNKFLSELYSDMYIELIREFPLFDKFLQEFIVSFFETVHTIEYVDPEVNYDEFCRITKANDRRKSTTTFIANTMKKGAVSVITIMNLLSNLITAVNRNVQTPNHAFHAEEITENIFILVSLCYNELKTHPEWNNVLNIIRTLSTQKMNETFPSMSNRVMFKFMDVLDCANK